MSKVWAVSVLFVSLLTGCAHVGPRSITAGRIAYAEAINQTQDEQLLLAVIKGCYGDSSTLLTVSGVAANMRFQAQAGIEAAFEGAGSPGDDLLIGGIAYEENPTITYVPVQGEEYVRHFMAPVSLDLLFCFMWSPTADRQSFVLLVDRINELRNRAFIPENGPLPDSRFDRFCDLFFQLKQCGVLQLVNAEGEGAVFSILIEPATPEEGAQVSELLELLGLDPMEDGGGRMVIPVYFGIRADDQPGIGITTRSTYDLAEILRAAVELPEDHLEAGVVRHYPPLGLAGSDIAVHSAERKPSGQPLSVKYHGYWFWIDEADLQSKKCYQLIRALWTINIAGATHESLPPLLTIPVGG